MDMLRALRALWLAGDCGNDVLDDMVACHNRVINSSDLATLPIADRRTLSDIEREVYGERDRRGLDDPFWWG